MSMRRCLPPKSLPGASSDTGVPLSEGFRPARGEHSVMS